MVKENKLEEVIDPHPSVSVDGWVVSNVYFRDERGNILQKNLDNGQFIYVCKDEGRFTKK